VRRVPLLIVAALATGSLVAAGSPAVALDTVNTKPLRDAVTVSGILSHERVLQRIANQNGGTRASGTPGFEASAAYVKKTLRTAGYTVKEQKFQFPFFRELAPATLAQTSPTPTDYQPDTFDYSGTGDVTGTVVATNDVQIPPGAEPSSSNSGCEPGDFTPATGTQVALIQRGTCDFVVKARNAEAAGYAAAIIFNEGQPGREGPLAGTLGEAVDIPVVGLTFAEGASLYADAQVGAVTVHVTTSTENIADATTSNVIAETPGGDANKVLVVGAHLDSVAAGPGINDNGSGSATILETAVQISKLKLKPRQKIRFIFFGAEEAGLLGSEHYVASLTDQQLAKIYANLNFDMLGSPNYVRFVYDGSDTESGPPGSAQIEQLFTDYFSGQGLATEPTPFDGRSDYGPFIEAGIPAGGLFSGAEGEKTADEAAVYGGTAGEAYDKCYHQACDTINNLNTKALAELGDGVAHAVWTLAKSKSGLYEDGSFARKVAPAKPLYKGDALVR
jgi:Zn-dependent M28 family amino/carboxypeptidase